MELRRRHVIQRTGAVLAAGAALATAPIVATSARARAEGGRPPSSKLPARSRVIISNDLAGDPDGLFSTVHALLSPSTQVRGIIGTFADGRAVYDPANGGDGAPQAQELATEIVRLMGLRRSVPTFRGADGKLTASSAPVRSPGAEAIIAEAMRTDTDLPLFVTVGAGLTEVASALLIEPAIADRMTVVWIGGAPYPDGGATETNFNEDPVAAQIVFNDTSVPLWQIPSDVYKFCQVSDAELRENIAGAGRIGHWLYAKLQTARETLYGQGINLNTGETWNMGDNPLVLLTALTGWTPSANTRPFKYENTPSSTFNTIHAPHLNGDGTYTKRSDGRKIRVYTHIDTRMMLHDFFAKMRSL
ncbi:nucleoside hydrolase [Actinomadura sp. WMMB 499]|uniref:nucleoside hydrolase n=1 Tax=Actinomadura sp. WMMB 499 TaxID=1219491 RepID=UPI0012493248|nr:nucleoside hydrolase [Actinomadura sp. WMMB 499]QFG22155.1 nucleoside hydrolase [Actinomadura sp. WMMB 499]